MPGKSPQTIPRIDIAPFMAGSGKAPATVAAVRKACEEIGFFAIAGHGVPDPAIARIYDLSRAFFDLPAPQKARVAKTGTLLGGLMHFPLKAESLGSTRGDPKPGDWKESLDYGPGFYGDAWPAAPAGLQQAWLNYYEVMGGLARVLRRILASAMGLPEDHFESQFDRHLSSLRINHYPDQPTAPEPGQLRAGAHTDYGFLTILRSEDAPGGLQVMTRAGDWIDVPTQPGTLLVNLADTLMRMTNDRWVSTPHRVVNPPRTLTQGTRRQSIAYFHNPNASAMVGCLPQFCDEAHPAKYESIRYGDYAALKYYQAHGETLTQDAKA
ncbi:isopenicillin N synthase family dioxygenase [Hypericibacter sp.]|uniref:isopenicillin N synthase family dioxygenase n=1 Tax=Hypericibacter sp. TaxID=2705401 RepID=UPI003D6D5091